MWYENKETKKKKPLNHSKQVSNKIKNPKEHDIL